MYSKYDFLADYRKMLSFILLILLFSSCKDKPTIIQPVIEDFTNSEMTINSSADNNHKIVIEDILQATKYTYLNVKEDDNIFWIAIPKTEVDKGNTYYYKGGIKMQNFQSKDHNRVFETLYLVAGLSKSPISPGGLIAEGTIDMEDTELIAQQIENIEGGISLKTLFADIQKYDGKVIIVKGKCVKVNRQILGKNWIHLQDGTTSESGDNLDLTITTDEEIQVGSVIAMQGRISLNKDFGAGYKYDVILEEAKRY